jgi:thioredoxin-related protein
MRGLLLAMLVVMPSVTVQDERALEDRFPREPSRPKALAPVQFGKSWDQARAESKRTGRRILAVFSGDHCGWCRVLEKRTFTDAEVVKRSKQFVCVELNTAGEENARLVDRYGIDTIPRSLVLTTDGEVVDRRRGYIPAAEFVTWLEAARTRSPTTAKAEVSAAVVPPPVGAPEPEADVVIWSVDASGSIKRWGDEDWTGHAHLLHLLRNAGLRPRVEHMARESFPARWDRAAAAGQLPELLMVDQMAGLVRDLGRQGRLLPLVSERLTDSPENASCPDLAGRLAFLVARSRHEDAGRKAAAELLRSGPEVPLPGPVLPDAEGRAEALAVARRAVVAYMAGDPVGLKAVAAYSSPQLTRCIKPEEFRQGRAVFAGSVEVRGCGAVAFARVEMQWQRQGMLGADAVLVILQRESSRWKAFAVSGDILSIKELAAFCCLELRAGTGPGDPPAPRLLYPADGERIGAGGKSFAWEVPGDVRPLAAQVCQVLLNVEKGSRWPETRLKLYPGAPRGRSLLWSETAKDLTGVTAEQMSWCVWSVGRDGRISVSEIGSYLPPELKNSATPPG